MILTQTKSDPTPGVLKTYAYGPACMAVAERLWVNIMSGLILSSTLQDANPTVGSRQ